MEKTQHLFEDGIYLIGNKAVARNPMFTDLNLQEFFLDKTEYYLSPISQILGYSLLDDQFNLLVRLKSRKDFETHFLSKDKNVKLNLPDIPESTYIFSQAMANLQVSFVKHFNFKFKRTGTLMASRFTRQLIETEVEMEDCIRILNEGQKLHSYAKKWSNDLLKPAVLLSSSWLYGGESGEGLHEFGRSIEHYLNGISNNLGECFTSLPPKRLNNNKNYFLKQYNRLFGPILSG